MSDAVADDKRTSIERKPDGVFGRAAMGGVKRKFRIQVVEDIILRKMLKSMGEVW